MGRIQYDLPAVVSTFILNLSLLDDYIPHIITVRYAEKMFLTFGGIVQVEN